MLIDNTINYLSEFILAIIDNELYHFKDMLKQPDQTDFIKAMEKEINIHECREYWE